VSRSVPSRALITRRLFAALVAVLLAFIPVPAPGPGGVASANAAGPPGVEMTEGITFVGEFAVEGVELDHLVVAWDEVLDPRFPPQADDFSVTINEPPAHTAIGAEILYAGVATNEFFFGDDGVTFMRVDLPVGVTVGFGDSIHVDYEPDGAAVRDLALNEAPAFFDVPAEIFDAGGFSPLVAVVDSYHGADKVVLVLSDPIEPDSLPDASQFTVTVGVTEVLVESVADLYPETGLAFLELTLETPVTDPESVVLVEYTSLPGTLISAYRGETLATQPEMQAVVVISTNATADTLDPGDTLSTASGAGPTPGDPLETTVTAAAPGDASITEGSVDEPSPPGYGFFGHQVVVELPDAPSPATPNVLTFGIDASVVPPGQNATTVQVFRDGVLVPNCTGAPGVAEPTPCVSERAALGGGDISLTVLTVQASTWNVGLLLPFEFDGFFAPVDNGMANIVKAGRAIPVKFSLGGDRGPDIFADGSPYSRSLTCSGLEDGDVVEETVTGGQSGLHYDAGTDTYTYVWKTNRAWTDTCRRLVLEFADGTTATAVFSFQ